mgnify:FL=1
MNKGKKQIKEYILLYMAFVKVTFLTQMEYRGQYFMRLFSKIIIWCSGFIMILVLLNRFQRIGNWSMYEVLFLYALNMLSYSIAGTFFMGPFGKLPRLIIRGELDQILIRPVNPLVYLICTKVSAGYTSNYIIGISVIIICIYQLNLSFNILEVLWLIIVIMGGVLIQAAGFIATGVPAFWILKSDGLRDIFFGNMTNFIDYPLSIYNRAIQILLTFILPYAFINYYPCQFFLQKQELFHPVFQFITPIVGIFLFFLSYQFWKKGLDAYQGTGS